MDEIEDYSQFDVQIGNKEYRMIAGRVQECRDEHAKADKPYEIDTELLEVDGHVGKVILKATVKTMRGTATGHAAAYDKTMIDKTAPYENAETSAVGRALGFLGYGLVTGIASAEEVTEAKKRSTTTSNTPRTIPPSKTINDKQVGLLNIWFGIAGVSEEWKENLKKINKIEHWLDLTKGQMDDIKNALIKSDHLAFEPMVDENGEPVLDGRGKQKELAYNPRTESAVDEDDYDPNLAEDYK